MEKIDKLLPKFPHPPSAHPGQTSQFSKIGGRGHRQIFQHICRENNSHVQVQFPGFFLPLALQRFQAELDRTARRFPVATRGCFERSWILMPGFVNSFQNIRRESSGNSIGNPRPVEHFPGRSGRAAYKIDQD